MLENVKSTYFIQRLFLNIDERKKLKLIKYNKKTQKILGIDINNYKLFKRKYVVYGENGLAEEYGINDNKLFYKGEYLNGERNGKGKEYNNDGDLIFEGEYLNGKRWNGSFQQCNIICGKGYVKEYEFYFHRGYLIYEGEYLNGERNGKGKESDKFGKFRFEGEYLNGKKYNGIGYDRDNNKEYELKYGNGYVKEVKNDIIYEWKYVNGEINGNGKEYSYDGQLNFEGEYLYGVKIKGKEYLENEIIFEGEFINDKKWKGKGKEYNRINQLIFEG